MNWSRYLDIFEDFDQSRVYQLTCSKLLLNLQRLKNHGDHDRALSSNQILVHQRNHRQSIQQRVSDRIRISCPRSPGMLGSSNLTRRNPQNSEVTPRRIQVTSALFDGVRLATNIATSRTRNCFVQM